MPRKTVYNEITTKRKLAKVNANNRKLENMFMEYLKSNGRSEGTILQYSSMFNIFWIWNAEKNGNEFFTHLTHLDMVKFFNYGMEKYGWSENRLVMFMKILSSMGKYIERELGSKFPNYKSAMRMIKKPQASAVREKTVLTDEDVARTLGHLTEEKDYMGACVFSLAINSGRTKSELMRFKIGYFRPEFRVCKGILYRTPEKIPTRKNHAGGEKETFYTLAVPFQPYLDGWVKERERRGILSEWMFPKIRKGKWKDEPENTTYMRSLAARIENILGKAFYWHCTRGRFIAGLVASGAPGDVIEKLTGLNVKDANLDALYPPRDEKLGRYFGAEKIKTEVI